jgi:hypothetical protein
VAKWWTVGCIAAMAVSIWLRSGWVTGGLGLVLFVSLVVVGRGYGRALRSGVDRSKGFVLHNAVVSESDVQVGAIESGLRRVTLSLAVTPRSGVAQARVWSPHRLRFRTESGAEVRSLTIERKSGRTWTPCPDNAGGLKGPHTLRITLQVAASTDRLFVHYFLESLGQIDLVRWTAPQVRS